MPRRSTSTNRRTDRIVNATSGIARGQTLTTRRANYGDYSRLQSVGRGALPTEVYNYTGAQRGRSARQFVEIMTGRSLPRSTRVWITRDTSRDVTERNRRTDPLTGRDISVNRVMQGFRISYS